MCARGLGRGFGSLIPTDWSDTGFDPTEEIDEQVSKLVELELKKIERDEEQPRREFDEKGLNDLAKSIKEHGVLQPIVVTKLEGGKYKIVAGERRWRAAKLAGLTKIPTLVRSLDGQKRLLVSVIENAQREDLNAIELAGAYAKLSTQFNLSIKEVAEKIGKSEGAITNVLRLLNLPEEAKRAMLKYDLKEGVMRPLVVLPEETVMRVLPKIIEEGWTARKVESYVKSLKPVSSEAVVKVNTYFKHEEKLEKKYHVKARVKARSITFVCKNEAEMKELLEKLG